MILNQSFNQKGNWKTNGTCIFNNHIHITRLLLGFKVLPRPWSITNFFELHQTKTPSVPSKSWLFENELPLIE